MAVHAFPPCFFTRASWLSVLFPHAFLLEHHGCPYFLRTFCFDGCPYFSYFFCTFSVLLDLGKDEPSMILQYRDAERGYVVWRDYTVDGDEQVLSPVDIDVLPAGRYRLV